MPEQHIDVGEEADLALEIAHLLFIDVVGYTKLLVNEEIELMQGLNRIVRSTACFREAEASGRLIRVPTGDGMVLLFFHSPEQPVRCALQITDALRAHPEMQLRMGIHSGPVNQITDVNDQMNVAGAGINIGQRVMDCGDAGHILLSQHLADDLVQYRHWQPYLHDLGECETKHGLRLHIVNLHKDGYGNAAVPEKLRSATRWKRSSAETIRPISAPRPPRTLLIGALLASGVAVGVSFWIFFQHPSSSQSGQPLPSVPEKSIAVLPFENRSEEKANAYFAAGIQDEIVTRLAKIGTLKVISRTSTEHYKSTPENLPEIARELGVAFILEGSVQKSGDTARINVQLIKAATDYPVWAESYDRRLTDIFSVESDIAKAIAESLRANLSGGEQQAVEAEPTKNAVAYDAYLRARQLETNPDTLRSDFKIAEQLYTRAVLLDPAFALAHARLAQTSAEIFHFYERTEPWRTKAKVEAEEALRLQPNLAEGHYALGLYFYWVEDDYERALQEFALAAHFAPGSTEPPFLVAAIRRRQGRWREALAAYNQIASLDPRNPNIMRNLVYTNTALRDWPAAARAAERWRAVAPDSINAKIQAAYVEFWWHGDTAALKTELAKIPAGVDPDGVVTATRWDTGMLDRDYAAAAEALRACPLEELSYLKIQPTAKSFLLGVLALARGDLAAAQAPLEDARAKFEAAVQEAPSNAERHANLGLVYAFLGRKDEAIREGLRAVELKPESKDALDGTVMNCYLALIYARVGKPDLALPLIERLLQTPGAVDSADYSITTNDLKSRWEWDPLRRDPRFEKIIIPAKP